MRALAGALLVLAGLAACSGPRTTTITASDYRFDNLPATVKAGTTLNLKNASATELHELLVVKLADGEQRSPEALTKLPGSQFDALLTGATVTALLRPPGNADRIAALGDGKLVEKGRYLVICTIPQGVDPAAFLAATRGRGDVAPVTGGPPHYALGMYGEIRVE